MTQLRDRCLAAEELILRHDVRGISALADLINPGYLARVAGTLTRPGTRLLLGTGFLVIGAGRAETDGPLGARAICDAVRLAGGRVCVVCDDPTLKVVSAAIGDSAEIAVMPIGADDEARIWSNVQRTRFRANAVGFIERCGRDSDGIFHSMHGADISAVTARTDYLISPSVASFSIGDGGNEVGFGKFAQALRERGITPWPSGSVVEELIIASVSNWGGYALAAAIAWAAGVPADRVLPDSGQLARRVERLMESGAVDGMSGLSERTIDGRDLDAENGVIEELLRIGSGP
jgi:hypothetical protein